MKYTIIFTFIFSFLLLNSCRSKQTRQAETPDSKIAETPIEEPADKNDGKSDVQDSISNSSFAGTDTTAQTFKGLYAYDRKNSTFRSCTNPVKLYIVEDSTQKLSGLYRKVLNNNFYSRESIYTEVKGYLKPVSNGKDSVLIVKEVLKTEAKSFTTECYPYEFIALGTEPFWSVDIIPVEDKIVLKDVSTDRVVIFPYREGRKGRDGVYVFEANNAKRESIRIIIRPETCSDGMSEREYKYSAEVRLGERILKGCAVKKGERIGASKR